MPTKLPHYVLLLDPAPAFLAGGALMEAFRLPLSGQVPGRKHCYGVLRSSQHRFGRRAGNVTNLPGIGEFLRRDHRPGCLAHTRLCRSRSIIGGRFSLLLRPKRSHAFVLLTVSLVVPGRYSLWLSRVAEMLVAASG
jgi:hypothetical protein